MNLTEARQALADAVSTINGVTCTPRPITGNLRLGDAWVAVGRLTPGREFGATAVTLSAFVVLGSDERLADQKVDELAGPLVACAQDDPDLYAFAISVEPQAVSAGDIVQGTLYTLALSVTLDLSE